MADAILDLARVVRAMSRSSVENYVTAGLTSSLVGGDGRGTVRLFTAERDTREFVAPHSHRFDFACVVIEGEVENIVFRERDPIFGGSSGGDAFVRAIVRPVNGGLGGYEVDRSDAEPVRYVESRRAYRPGDVYAMRAEEIHSIRFARHTSVLFLEGPEQAATSVVLEPFEYGRRVETFEVRPWMFRRGSGLEVA